MIPAPVFPHRGQHRKSKELVTSCEQDKRLVSAHFTVTCALREPPLGPVCKRK